MAKKTLAGARGLDMIRHEGSFAGRAVSMRITVLTHLEREGDDKSYDVVVDQVAQALRSLGHDTAIVGVHADIRKLIDGLTNPRPHLVFNLMETFGKTQFGSIGVVGLLDLLKVKYTGGGPGEFFLQEDKSITKKLLAFEGVAFPPFAVFGLNSTIEASASLHMPLFVKPLRMDASIGINGRSIVRNLDEMMQRVLAIHKLKDAALVEEYIDGREFFVSVLGNQDAVALPPIEIDYSGLPEHAPKVLDSKAKWDPNSPRFKGTKAVLADIPDDLRKRLQDVALKAYRALKVKDYGRVDLRMNQNGEIYVIEVNASCYLERNSEFAKSAEAAGMDYPTLIQRIVDLALERQAKRVHA